MGDTRLAILLEFLYKNLGLKQAQSDLKSFTASGTQASADINKMALGLGSLRGDVTSYANNLKMATPQNVAFGQSFSQIKTDFESGKISIEGAQKAIAGLQQDMGNATTPVQALTGALGKLALAGVAIGALKFSAEFIKDSALLAARVKTLGVVTEVMGKTAGYTSDEIKGFEKGIMSMGITTRASREAISQLIRAQIDLSQATDLARLAQDGAVVSGDNSSEAFSKLSLIIATGNTYMARHMGLMVNFEKAYSDYAATLGKTVDQLTAVELAQARTNEVLNQGVMIEGAYEAAMETAGKKLSSYPRYWEELSLAVGTRFTGALGWGVDAITGVTKAVANSLNYSNNMKDALDAGVISQRTFNLEVDKGLIPSFDSAKANKLLATAIEYSTDASIGGRESFEDYAQAMAALNKEGEDLGLTFVVLTEQEYTNKQAYLASIDVVAKLSDEFVEQRDRVIALKDAEKELNEITQDGVIYNEHQRAALENLSRQRSMAERQAYYTLTTERLLQSHLENMPDVYDEMRDAVAGLADEYKALTQYSSAFAGGQAASAKSVKDIVIGNVMAEIEALTQLGMVNKEQETMYQEKLDLLYLLDPVLGKQMETSRALTQYQAQLSAAHDQGIISNDEYAASVNNLTSMMAGAGDPTNVLTEALSALPIPAGQLEAALSGVQADLAAGVDPAEALVNAMGTMKLSSEDWEGATAKVAENLSAGMDPLEAITTATDDLTAKTEEYTAAALAGLSPELGEGFTGPILDGVIEDLKTISDVADDTVLMAEDEASPIIQGAVDLIDQFTGIHTATLRVNGPGKGFDLGGMPYVAEASAMTRPVAFQVPAGYPNDSFRMRVQTGEGVAVWNASKGFPGGGGRTDELLAQLIARTPTAADISRSVRDALAKMV